MTVKELIEALREMPQEAPVFFEDEYISLIKRVVPYTLESGVIEVYLL